MILIFLANMGKELVIGEDVKQQQNCDALGNNTVLIECNNVSNQERMKTDEVDAALVVQHINNLEGQVTNQTNTQTLAVPDKVGTQISRDGFSGLDSQAACFVHTQNSYEEEIKENGVVRKRFGRLYKMKCACSCSKRIIALIIICIPVTALILGYTLLRAANDDHRTQIVGENQNTDLPPIKEQTKSPRMLDIPKAKCSSKHMPHIKNTERKDYPLHDGWTVGYKCLNNSTPSGEPGYMSYYYSENAANYTCKSGAGFIYNKLLSCQGIISLLEKYGLPSIENVFCIFQDTSDKIKHQSITKAS